MKITILCTSVDHPINCWLKRWIGRNNKQHQIDLIRKKSDLSSGDLLFLISCAEIIGQTDRETYKKTLVIHASALPEGRGWNPHIWQILEGREQFVITLLEAEDKVDTGDIWHQVKINISKDALYAEINQAVFDAELELMDYAVSNFETVKPISQQQNIEPSYYRLRNPMDSRIDVTESLEKQFDLIRVCDPFRFPAFFHLHGKKYKLMLEKMDDE